MTKIYPNDYGLDRGADLVPASSVAPDDQPDWRIEHMQVGAMEQWSLWRGYDVRRPALVLRTMNGLRCIGEHWKQATCEHIAAVEAWEAARAAGGE